MTNPDFNEEDIRKFYQFFHHKNPTEIRVFDPVKYPKGKSIFVKDEDEFVKKVYQLNVVEEIDVYIGGRDRTARGDNNVVSSFYIFCELDMHEGDNPELVESFETLLQMNAIKIGMKILSGGGYHYYIPHQFEKIDDINREKYKQFLYAFRDSVVSKGIGIDTKIFNLERVSRIAGTFNWKRNKISKLIFCNEMQQYEIEQNTKNIKKFVNSCVIPKKILTQNVTVLGLLQEYYIHKNDKWLYEIFEKNVIIKPDTGGNSVVFKNAAILCMQYKMKSEEVEFLGKELAKHCEDRTYTAFCGWIRKIKNNEIGMFNANEINKWIDEQKYPLSKYRPIESNNDWKIENGSEIINRDFGEQKYVVNKVIPADAIVFVAGSPGDFKSFYSLYLGMCISSGKKVLDLYSTEKAGVLFIDEENGLRRTARRMKKISYALNLQSEDLKNLYLCSYNDIKLNTKEKWFVGENTETVEKMTKLIREHDIKLVILDSMIRMLEGEENNSSDVKTCFLTLKKIMVNCPDISFLVIHHLTKSGQNKLRDLRGSGDLGAMASIVYMFHAYDNKIFVNTTKNRDLDSESFPLMDFMVEDVLDDQNEKVGIVFKHMTKEVKEEASDELLEKIRKFIDDKEYKKFKNMDVAKEMKVGGYGGVYSTKTLADSLKAGINREYWEYANGKDGRKGYIVRDVKIPIETEVEEVE